MKKVLLLLLAAGGLAAFGAATQVNTSAAAPSAAGASTVACTSASIGIAAPLTGPAAFLGQEQLSWTQFAVQRFNTQNRTSFKLVQGDTQLSAALARTVARQFAANSSMVGVVGPSTSQAVISGAPLFRRSSLAAVSGSATRVDLTNGQFPTFFRVVPNDSVQAPDVVRYISQTLKARRVLIIDSQDDYSTALATAMEPGFRRANVTVDRESVAASDTDFSSIVSGIEDDVSVVVFATQTASAAQTLSQQLLEQGKRAVVFGTDGAFQPAQFKPRNGYVSVFAPDIKRIRAQAALVRAYNTFSRNKSFGSFGPPSYIAATVLMTSMRNACRSGNDVTRAEVLAGVRRANLPSILGGRVSFTRRGDVANPKFYIFRIQNGTYRTVG